jgi:hypothetical protein
MRRAVAAGALALVVLSIAALGDLPASATTSAAPTRSGTHVGRVLVLSLPTVEWADLERVHTPNLHRLLAGAAVGSLATNGVLTPSPLGDGYVTLGASAPATADRLVVGQGFGADEEFGTDTAGRAFETRTGVPATSGLVYLPIASVTDTNAAENYDAKVGALGDALARAGVSRAVIANGDGSDPSTPERLYPSYRRAAVSALMTSTGKVPDGKVDRELLMDDSSAPFGVRLDNTAVVSSFDDAWRATRSVVLVEGSDLVRADIEGQLSSEHAREKLRDRALRHTDRLVGRLMQHVDLARDAVIVVAPAAPEPDTALTVAAVRAPGFGSGLLRSSTTGRDGYVNLVDVAPTVLDVLGIDRPDTMQGQPMDSVSSDATVAQRVSDLSAANIDSIFRDAQADTAAGIVFGIGVVLAIATAGLVDRVARSRAYLAFGALWLLGFLVATYLAGPFHFGRHGGAGAYWAFVVGVATVLAVVARLAGWRLGKPVDALLVALGLLVAVHLIDLITGAHLELDTVFGYSATFDVRVGGISGWAFGQLTAAAMLFAGLLAWRVPSRAGQRIAIAVLVVSVLVIGAPFFGNDFGGSVVAAVAFGILAWRLAGRPLRAVSTTAAIVVFLALAVVVGVVRSDRGNALTDAGRAARQNVPVFEHSVLVGMVFVVALLLAYLWYVRPQSLRGVVSVIPTVPPTMLAFAIVALLGVVLNDPGVSIPGMMAVVLESSVVHLSARRP